MLGIGWDIDKLVRTIDAVHENEKLFLQGLIAQRDRKIEELEQLLFKQVGIIKEVKESEAPAPIARERPTIGRTRTWKEQKQVLEERFRPPELVAREKRWRKEAEQNAEELLTEERGSVNANRES
jgi:hypothetical protein